VAALDVEDDPLPVGFVAASWGSDGQAVTATVDESIANTEAAPFASRRILQVSGRVLSGDDGGDRAGGELPALGAAADDHVVVRLV
jgi:hypothetical protein